MHDGNPVSVIVGAGPFPAQGGHPATPCGIGSAVDPDQAGAMAPAEAAAAHRTAQHVLEVVSHPPRGLWVFGLLHSAVVSSPYPD